MTPTNFTALAAVANAGTPTSAAYSAQFVQFATVQAVFSDVAAAGSLRIEQSNDTSNPTNWSPIAASAFAVTAGGTQVTPVVQICAQFYRVVFASTAGAGTITARIHAVGDAS